LAADDGRANKIIIAVSYQAADAAAEKRRAVSQNTYLLYLAQVLSG
jgi:hypothetical protein